MRRAFAVIVTAALVLAGGGPASLAATSAPAARTLTVAAPAHSAEGIRSWSVDLDSAAGTTTSPELHTEEITLAALSWSRASAPPRHVELRVLEEDGWSTWFDLVVDESEAPDGRLATEPLIADGARGLQVRVEADAPLAGLRLDLVHVADAEAAADPAVHAPAKSARGDEIRPKIVTRAQWGANESKTKPVASSTWLKAMYVHHTAGPNSYSKSRAKAVVRSVWAFHTGGRGWPDIGYQFLVDRFGTIYEGRRGAIEGIPIGAQAGGYNGYTIGVAVMGNHSSVNPAQRVVDSVVDVLAWQAHRWGLDPRDKVRLRTAPSTGSKTRWSLGKLTPALPVIRGHRDTNHTACPGARLYAKLPAIRRAVDAKVTKAIKKHGATPAQLRAPRVDPLSPDAHRVSLSARVKLSWRKVPRARGYEVVRRMAKHGHAVGQAKFAWMVVKDTKRTSAKVRVPRGQTWTIGIRAIDTLGRPGKVRRVGTTTRPVPVKHVTRSGAWRTAKRSSYFQGKAHVSRDSGATLTVRAKRARAVWLVAATGTSSGRVTVYAGKKRVATVSLTSPSSDPRALVEVPLHSKFTGTVRIVARDAKRPVRISALILERGHQ